MKIPALPWRRFLRSLWCAPDSRAHSSKHRTFRVPRLEMLESRISPAALDPLATAVPLPFDRNLQARAASMLADANQVNLYQVQLQAGDEVTAQVQAYSPQNPLDSGLRIFDRTGRQLAFNDN